MGEALRDEIHADVPDLRESIIRHVRSSMARRWARAWPREQFFAVSLAVRDRIDTRATLDADAPGGRQVGER